MQDKIRLLAFGDYACSTGFGRVMSELMRQLEATGRYAIDVVGINYSGDPYDPERWPGRVYPAMSALNLQGAYGDVFGRQRVLDLLATGNYDVLFMLQDTFVIQGGGFMDGLLETQRQLAGAGKAFKVVYYYPLDAPPKKDWITDVVSRVDYPVTYTNWAKAETLKVDPSLKDRLKVIYHGTSPEDFHYIEDRGEVMTFRHNWFNGVTDGKFLVTNVNRNQSRKDIVRNFMILKELKDQGIKDVMLYLHMQPADVGGNLLVMADNFGLELEKDWICPNPKTFTANSGYSTSIVNAIYNASDAVLTTTLGEGWGLSVTEAMATRTPVIAPNHTSLREILSDKRGYLVPAGDFASHWITKEMDNERLRPLMNVDAAAQAIVSLKTQVQRGPVDLVDLDEAQAFTRKYTWSQIVQEWTPIIDAAAAEAKTQQSVSVPHDSPTTMQHSPLTNRAARRKAKKSKH